MLVIVTASFLLLIQRTESSPQRVNSDLTSTGHDDEFTNTRRHEIKRRSIPVKYRGLGKRDDKDTAYYYQDLPYYNQQDEIPLSPLDLIYYAANNNNKETATGSIRNGRKWGNKDKRGFANKSLLRYSGLGRKRDDEDNENRFAEENDLQSII